MAAKNEAKTTDEAISEKPKKENDCRRGRAQKQNEDI